MGGDKQPIHIVADFGTGGGACAQAIAFGEALAGAGAALRGWHTGHPSRAAAGFPGGLKTVSAFGGSYPVGGTLVIVGPGQAFSPWIERSRAARLIVWSDSADGEALFRLLGVLRASRLPEAELALSCRQLSETLGVEARLVPPLLAVPPVPARRANPYPRIAAVGVEPADWSRYKSWSLAGIDIVLPPIPGLQLPAEWAGITLAPAEEAFAAGLAGADIFVTPAPAPGGGLPFHPLCRAMAAGCAVVASGEGLDEWISDGETGLLARDGASLYEQAVDLARHPERCRRLGEAARSRAEALGGRAVQAALAAWLQAAPASV